MYSRQLLEGDSALDDRPVTRTLRPTLLDFLSWLSTREPHRGYDYTDWNGCAVTTFLREACGHPRARCDYEGWQRYEGGPNNPPFWQVPGTYEDGEEDMVLQGRSCYYPSGLSGQTYGRLLARYAHHGYRP